VRLAACPGQRVVDDAGALQRGGKLFVGAVDVAHRDDAVDVIEAPLICTDLGGRQCRQQQNERRERQMSNQALLSI
jgi:hypothetical protein